MAKTVLALETNKYAIKLENFEGPLDLLCHLIDKNKMDICDIQISHITEQYLDYLNKMEELNLEVASEFVIMASTLLYLKSKTLLPKQSEDEEDKEMTEEELLRRIMEYKKYKEITNAFRSLYAMAGNQYGRQPEKLELPKQKLEKDYDKQQLIELYQNLTQRNEEKINQNAKNIEKIALTETYTVGSKVKQMYRELVRRKRFVFNTMFSIQKCNRAEVVTAFSGMLEMSRRNKVTTSQETIFGDILVEKAKRKVE